MDEGRVWCTRPAGATATLALIAQAICLHRQAAQWLRWLPKTRANGALLRLRPMFTPLANWIQQQSRQLVEPTYLREMESGRPMPEC